MSLLFIDSFDHYGTADIGLKWSAVTGTGVTITSGAGRRGGGALRISDYRLDTVRKDFVGVPTIIVGTAAKLSVFGVSPYPNVLLWLGGTLGQHIYIVPTGDGSLQVWRTEEHADTLLGTTTAAAIAPNVFFYIEVKLTVSATVGAVKILINGATVMNLIGINTLGFGTAALITQLTLGTINSGALSGDYVLFDDLYICDTAGSLNNDFFGDVRVDLILPNADGTYLQFTPDTGTVHYSRVNELVADTSSNVASSTVGHKDSYQFSDLAAVAGTIRGVQIVDAALKDDAGTRSIAHLTKSGASEVTSSAIPLSTDRKLYTTIQETDPATTALWTLTGINGAEFGIVVAA